jgi:hypothetical protein
MQTMNPLAIIKLINGVMSMIQFFGSMFRDAEIKQSGRDQVIAAGATRLVKAREKAIAKVQNFNDAIAVANSKLRHIPSDSE